MKICSDSGSEIREGVEYVAHALLGGVTRFEGVYVIPQNEQEHGSRSSLNVITRVVTNHESGNVFLVEGGRDDDEEVIIVVNRAISGGGYLMAVAAGAQVYKLYPGDWVEYSPGKVAINHGGRVYNISRRELSDVKFVAQRRGKVDPEVKFCDDWD